MTEQQAGYVRKETLIGVVINAVLSAVFVFLIFRGRDLVPVGEIAFDALPQSFMVALMTTIVPTALTRRRLRSGVVAPLPLGRLQLPHNLVLRGLLVALVVAVASGALHWLVLPSLSPAAWSFATLLTYKVTYGGLLALVLGPFVLRRALVE